MSEMLYLQTERNIKITSPVVTLGDVAQLSCSDGAVLARNQVRRVAHLPDDGYGRYVCSASTLVRLVTEAEEHVDVTHIGEPNFILTYEDPRQKNTWISWCKTILVGILTFIGTAFSIMTFHTDIGVRELFLDVYTRFLPQMTPGFSVLEISYSIGIGLGVVLYFNHFGRRKFTQDPTPLEVEMRVYEDDIDTTIIKDSREPAFLRMLLYGRGAVRRSFLAWHLLVFPALLDGRCVLAFCGHLSGKLDHRARRSRQPVFDPLPPDRTDARTAVCNSLHGGRENRGLSLLFCKWISIRTGGKM